MTPDFIPPNLWPTNSPASNPVNYNTIWGTLYTGTGVKHQIQGHPGATKTHCIHEWDKLDQSVIDKAGGEWGKRPQSLSLCIEIYSGTVASRGSSYYSTVLV